MSEHRPEMPGQGFFRSGFHARSQDQTEATVLAALEVAVATARTGDLQRARQLCAEAVFQAQPVIATRADLLRVTLYSLLVARGIKFLSRIVLAISRRKVDVILLEESNEQSGVPRSYEERSRMVLVLHPGWIDRLSSDDTFLR